jgi:hypothetical protein
MNDGESDLEQSQERFLQELTDALREQGKGSPRVQALLGRAAAREDLRSLAEAAVGLYEVYQEQGAATADTETACRPSRGRVPRSAATRRRGLVLASLFSFLLGGGLVWTAVRFVNPAGPAPAPALSEPQLEQIKEVCQAAQGPGAAEVRALRDDVRALEVEVKKLQDAIAAATRAAFYHTPTILQRLSPPVAMAQATPTGDPSRRSMSVN